jgi:hypothetical protein
LEGSAVTSLRSLFSCVLVLSSVPSLAWADEPSLGEWAQRRVEQGIVRPLAQQESSRFSRARPPPRERRVKVTQSTGTLDKSGHVFLSFAIAVRFGSEWHENDIVGCVYTGSGTLFVKKGDSYRPATFLLGKNEGPVAGVCEAAPPARS